MQMPTDDRILEALNSGLILTPSVIGENINRSRQHVSRRLSELQDHSYIAKVKRGHYQITEKGEAYLSGEIGGKNN